MSQRYLGGIITANPTAPTLASASGVWTQEQYFQYIQGLQPKVIGQSVRFRSSASAYFNRTFGTATNNKIFTISAWVKLGNVGSVYQHLIGSGSDASNFSTISLNNGSNQIQFFVQTAATNRILLTTQPVYRDPSAWYHVVVAIDTTQATTALGALIYVNGVQQTVTPNTWTQNQSTFFNSTYAAQIGYSTSLAANGAPYNVYFDGYLNEVNFIDGQALTPSSFGAYDSNGVWQPFTYTGTYGNNGFYLPFTVGASSTYALTNTGATKYINAPNSALFAQQSTTNWTVEAWVNSSSATLQELFVYGNSTISTGNDVSFGISYTPGSTFNLFQYNGINNTGVSSTLNVPSGQWCHIAAVNNGGTVTLYLNGAACGTASAVNTNSTGTMLFYIGNYGSARYINGQVSNFRLVKGTAVYTSNFTPPTSPLTAIANTVLLTCQDSTFIDNSTNAFTLTNTGSLTTIAATPFGATIGSDSSGNGNNWYANNINYSTSGVTYDSMLDSPSNFNNGGNGVGNYCVGNAIDPTTSKSMSNGNLSLSGSSYNYGHGTFTVSSGQWYWEATNLLGANDGIIGVDFGYDTTTAGYPGATATSYGYGWNAVKRNNTSSVAYGATYTTNDVIGIAIDLNAGTLTFYKNGTSQGVAFSSLSGNATPHFGCQSGAGGGGSGWAVNFGQRPFTYTPPTGFVALNTQNLAVAAPPTISNGANYMAAVTYSGDSTYPRTITNGGNNAIGKTFYPDLVWQKARSTTYDYNVYDSVRGTGTSKMLGTNSTSAEGYDSSYANLTAFTSSGFTVGTTSLTNIFNNSGQTYVAWQWNAGSGSTLSNTNGSITSSVSAGATQGFSVVAYTGTGANATVGHGLGAAPSMIIVKNRASAVDWLVYHSSLTSAAYYLILNSTAAQDPAGASIWNSTAPTSSVFSVGTSTGSNSSATNYVAYCFAAVKGYSAFSSYTGNGSTDGTFVYTGFRPRWILVKRTDAATYNWILWDSSRNTYNVTDLYLNPNLSAAEATGVQIDLLSNGFKARATDANINASGGTYIYAAFAENPFTIARAR